MYLHPCKRVQTYITAWGVYSVHFIGSGVWRCHVFLMSSIEFLTLFLINGSPLPQGNRCRRITSTDCGIQIQFHTDLRSEGPCESKFKDIYIGKLIQQKVDERGISYAEFARQIHCARTSLYHIFNSKNIDVERLLLISEVLQYNFIEEVYLRKLKSTDENVPCIVIPFKEKGIDTSQLPNEVLEWLKQQLL